ncbi:hypothetical protein U1Q18_051849, partial [Sarracenia purpurea var. burkii]
TPTHSSPNDLHIGTLQTSTDPSLQLTTWHLPTIAIEVVVAPHRQYSTATVQDQFNGRV